MTCVNYYTNNYAAKMLFCLLEIIKKYIFLCFNVIDLPVLQGYQGTGRSTVYLHARAKTINVLSLFWNIM